MTQIAGLFLSVSIPFIFVFHLIDQVYLMFSVLPFAMLFTLALVLSLNQQDLLAKMTLILTGNAALIFYAATLGPAAGVQYIFYGLAITPLIFFSTKRWQYILFGVCLSLISLFGLEVLLYQVPVLTNVVLPSDQLRFISYTMKTVAFVVLLASFKLFFSFLHSSNESLQKSFTSLKRSREVVERSAQMSALGTLTMGVCHEIKTPLSALKCQVDELLHCKDNPVAENETKQLIFQSIKNLDEVVDAMINFGREDGGKFRRFRASSLLNQVSQLFPYTLRSQKITLCFEGPTPTTDFFIEGNLGQLRQVLLSLLSNARDAIKSAGEITLRLRQESFLLNDEEVSGVRMEVEDTGRGIPKEKQQTVFDPFYTSKGPGHSGMGLAIVYRIVQIHRGVIDLHSVPGKTRITIWIPLVAQAEHKANSDLLEAHSES